MAGGSGDADLYVRYGSQPTTSSYTCRPYLNGNNETWQKDGQRISVLFSIDSDPNEDHYLYLHVYEKKK